MQALSPHAARARLHDGREVAFVDIREAGQFIEGHPLLAVPIPYSQLELDAPRLIPRRDVAVILCDDGDGVAERAARHLDDMGYSDLAWVAGGIPAWRDAGLPLFKGVNVPSKVLGELAEEIWHPQTLTADEVAERHACGKIGAIFDARPAAEHRKMRVPFSICLPNGELAHRIEACPGSDATPLVITCAGRTRGIIGAIGLRLSGYEGPVAVLENGTQGWALSGRDLERGATDDPMPILTSEQHAASRVRAKAMADRFDLPVISGAEASRMTQEQGRSTFIFDLRSQDEEQLAPLTSATRVDGVQLVQATDQFVGIRHARLILCCNTGLRSVIAAFWLRQLGFEPYVVRLDDGPLMPCDPSVDTGEIPAPRISFAELRPDDILIDIRPSGRYMDGHAAGARWAIRPRINALDGTARDRRLIVIEERPGTGALFALDARGHGFCNVAVLKGGHGTLVKAGRAIETGTILPDSTRIDFPFFVHDRHQGNLDASRRYLAWETGLVAALDATDRAAFRLTTP